MSDILTPEFLNIIILLMRWFQGDANKVIAWLNIANINLGGQTPLELLYYNREKQLLKFVRDAVDNA